MCIVKFLFSYKDDLLESLIQTTALWYRKSTFGWRPSLKNAADKGDPEAFPVARNSTI